MSKKNLQKDTPVLAPSDAIVMPAGAVPEPVPQTRAGLLVAKLQELGSIANVIEIYARKITGKEKKAIDALEAQMSKQIGDFLIESRITEADIKIAIMRQVAEIVQRSPIKK